MNGDGRQELSLRVDQLMRPDGRHAISISLSDALPITMETSRSRKRRGQRPSPNQNSEIDAWVKNGHKRLYPSDIKIHQEEGHALS